MAFKYLKLYVVSGEIPKALKVLPTEMSPEYGCVSFFGNCDTAGPASFVKRSQLGPWYQNIPFQHNKENSWQATNKIYINVKTLLFFNMGLSFSNHESFSNWLDS